MSASHPQALAQIRAAFPNLGAKLEAPPLSPAAITAHIDQRAGHLLKLCSNWYAQALLDPRGPHTLRHAGCIEQLAEQARSLLEIVVLCDAIGLFDTARQAEATIDALWHELCTCAHQVRLASVGLAHLGAAHRPKFSIDPRVDPAAPLGPDAQARLQPLAGAAS